MLHAAAALVSIHPIHVLREPVARHKGHALLKLPQHGIQLMAWLHSLHEGPPLLAHGRGEGEVVATHVETLRIGEGLVAVDGVSSSRAELMGCGLRLWLAPLVALPIWMARIIVRASMVGHLLHLLVALVHVELVAATQTIEALGIAIPIMVLALLRPWHAHQVEIQIATTAWPCPLEVNVDREGLARKRWVIEIVGVAVVCGELVHEVKPVRWPKLHCESIVQSSCPWEVIGVVDPILVDDDFAFLSIG